MHLLAVLLIVVGFLWLGTMFFEKVMSFFGLKPAETKLAANSSPASVPVAVSPVVPVAQSVSFLGATQTIFKRSTAASTDGDTSPENTSPGAPSVENQKVTTQENKGSEPDENEKVPTYDVSEDFPDANEGIDDEFGDAGEQGSGDGSDFPFDEDAVDDAALFNEGEEPAGKAPDLDEDAQDQATGEGDGFDEDDEEDDHIPNTMAGQLGSYGTGTTGADEYIDLEIEEGGIDVYNLRELVAAEDNDSEDVPLTQYMSRIGKVQEAATLISQNIALVTAQQVSRKVFGRSAKKAVRDQLDHFALMITAFNMPGDENVNGLIDRLKPLVSEPDPVSQDPDYMAMWFQFDAAANHGVTDDQEKDVLLTA